MGLLFTNDSLLQNRAAADQLNRCAIIKANEPDKIEATIKNHAGSSNSISHLAF
jgi:hypothetical protein